MSIIRAVHERCMCTETQDLRVVSDDKVRVVIVIVLYELFTNELFYIFCQRKTVKKENR